MIRGTAILAAFVIGLMAGILIELYEGQHERALIRKAWVDVSNLQRDLSVAIKRQQRIDAICINPEQRTF